MTAALLREFMPYGAPELQDAARPQMVGALALSSVLASLTFALAWALCWMLVGTATPPAPLPSDPRIVDLIDRVLLPPPPAIEPIRIAAPRSATAAMPVPVPDEVAPLESTAPSQAELGTLIGPGTTAAGPGEGSVVPEEGPVNEAGTIPWVDQLPAPVTASKPEYPDLARQAQVEGLVLVYVLVGTDGRVRDARVDREHNVPLLNEAALEAARRWVFTPALSGNHPVSVWVNIPFRFTLRN